MARTYIKSTALEIFAMRNMNRLNDSMTGFDLGHVSHRRVKKMLGLWSKQDLEHNCWIPNFPVEKQLAVQLGNELSLLQ